MEQIISAAERCIDLGIWHAALASALVLPDVCIGIEQPDLPHGDRYRLFHKRYLEQGYTLPLPLVDTEREAAWDETYTAARNEAVLTGNWDRLTRLRRDAPPIRYEQRCFFPADDFYGLRCAILHDGTHHQTLKGGRTFDTYAIIAPPPAGFRHLNLGGDGTLQLQVDVLCREICQAARRWDAEIGVHHATVKHDRLLRF